MTKTTEDEIVQTRQTDVVTILTSKTLDEEVCLFSALIIGTNENDCSNALEDMVDVVEVFSGCASMTSVGV